MDNTRWIVVGTSFSESARRALSYAIKVAGETGARIALTHAYEDALDPSIDVAPWLYARLDAEIERSGAARHRVHVEPILRRGAPWDKLRDVAMDLDADLIVIGTGHATDPLAAGNLMTRVITAARRLVLVIAVRPPHARDDLSSCETSCACS